MISLRWIPRISLLAALLLAGIGLSPGLSQDKKAPEDYKAELPRIPPRSTADSQKAMQLFKGFRAELAASEPGLASPVAIDFDENGRLYAAEYPEYNAAADPKFKELGRVRLLEDADGDGFFEKNTLFADNLPWGATVFCYNGGVLVGAAPDIWFLKDTNGDGKADIRKKVLTGFGRDAAGEAMLNSFRWGLDNRIHISTGLVGGEVSVVDDPGSKAREVRNQRVLYDPRHNRFELTSGGGQHGFSMDDFGRAFVCSNSVPSQVIAFDNRYLKRNPFAQAPSPAVDTHEEGKFTRIYRISPDEPWRILRTKLRNQKIVPGSAEGGKPSGFFTGATGITSYRGDAYPAEYKDRLFIGEVAGNLVHCARLEEKGILPRLTSLEKEVEFLASEDIWFRPVQIAHGPDGCLYVIDMYRGLIEGAAFLPPELVKHLHVMDGAEKGRIWRIAHEGMEKRKPPQLGRATSLELVALLEHPNGWHRDTASRLLYQRNDASVAPALVALAKKTVSPVARVHALWALDGIGKLKLEQVLAALDDAHPRVREQGIILSEKFSAYYRGSPLREKILALLADPEPRVRLQAVYSLDGAFDRDSTIALASVAMKESGDPWFRLALLSHSPGSTATLFKHLMAQESFRHEKKGQDLLLAQAKTLAVCGLPDAAKTLLETIDSLPEKEQSFASALAAQFLETPTRQAVSGKARTLLALRFNSARAVLGNEKSTPEKQIEALRILTFDEFAQVRALFAGALQGKRTVAVQQAALEGLTRVNTAAAGELIVASWKGLGPQAKPTALEALLSRKSWVPLLLDGMEGKTIPAAEIDPGRMKIAQGTVSPALASRMEKLLSSSSASRLEVFTRYKKALEIQGDVLRGKEVFKQQCGACHSLAGVGTSVGADLVAARHRGMEAILLNIIDPNREVKPAYVTYVVTLNTGRLLSGMITGESLNSITLRKADNQSETFLRGNIEEMRSTGVSYMPEGLEKQISIEAMADLLSFMDSIR